MGRSWCVSMTHTKISPPHRNLLPQDDLLYAIRNNLPVIIAADINARHKTFGYNGPFNEQVDTEK